MHFDRLTYSAGNEHSPTDPFGRTELLVEAGGAARLDHHERGRHRAWRGRVSAEALDRLAAALDASGFPETPGEPFVACSTIRRVVVERGRERLTAELEWHAPPRLPGYDELFTVLDSLVRQLSGDTHTGVRDALPPSVSDLEPV
jgi:hypothetical protein